jgi:sugar transferase (PEP-CTERM/EpsH1 system associated)
LKVLVVLSRFPLPTDKGDKLRAWHHILGLAEKHQVFLFCLTNEKIQADDLEKVKAVCADVCVVRQSLPGIILRILLNVFSKLPFQVAYFTSRYSVSRLKKYTQQVKPDVLYCQLVRMAAHCKSLEVAHKVIDYQDAFSKGLERRLQHESFFKRLMIQVELKRLRVYETEVFDQFEKRFIISEQDAGLIDHPARKEMIILPNGVDVDYYKPEPAAKTIDLLFTGNMQYEPNVNCVSYLVKEVFPLLKEDFPHIQLVAAGKNPSSELSRLHSRNLQLTGWVKDLRKYYQQARLFVAPMQIGIGMQNKILEAMSMGMPVITSSLANNAIGAKHGKEIWIADTPAKVAEAISYLLNNTELAIRLGQNARELMLSRYSWAEQNKALNRFLEPTDAIASENVQTK